MTAHARISDPETSHEAASSVSDISETQIIIRALLAGYPMTDEELIRSYQNAVEQKIAPMASESGIRSRRAELVDRGLVRDSGRFGTTRSGRRSKIWEAV